MSGKHSSPSVLIISQFQKSLWVLKTNHFGCTGQWITRQLTSASSGLCLQTSNDEHRDKILYQMHEVPSLNAKAVNYLGMAVTRRSEEYPSFILNMHWEICVCTGDREVNKICWEKWLPRIQRWPEAASRLQTERPEHSKMWQCVITWYRLDPSVTVPCDGARTFTRRWAKMLPRYRSRVHACWAQVAGSQGTVACRCLHRRHCGLHKEFHWHYGKYHFF